MCVCRIDCRLYTLVWCRNLQAWPRWWLAGAAAAGPAGVWTGLGLTVNTVCRGVCAAQGAGVCRVCRLQEATLQRAGGRRPELEQGCCGQCTLVPGVVCTEELATGKVLPPCLIWTLIGLWPSYRLLIGCQRSLLVSNCTCRGLCRAERASAVSATRQTFRDKQ